MTTFHSSVIGVLAALSVTSPSAAALTSTLIPTQAQTKWDFITDADDGTLYFGRNVQHFDGMTFVLIKKEADPEGGNGDAGAWRSVFRCDAKTFLNSNDEWEPIRAKTVGEEWIKYACKGRTKLSDHRSVGA